VKTNAWLLARCLADNRFIAGEVDTAFIDAQLASLTARPEPSPRAVAAVGAILADKSLTHSLTSSVEPWMQGLFGYRVNAGAGSQLRLRLESHPADIVLSGVIDGAVVVRVGGETFLARRTSEVEILVEGSSFRITDAGDIGQAVFEAGAAFTFGARTDDAVDAAGPGGDAVRAPMPGRIVSIAHVVGTRLKLGDTVLTLEAMKMEHALKAPFDGVLVELNAKEGDQVAENTVLARLEPWA
jgi:propionyl-CoA carboxylase alpha chain/3-methylcrotonyl-CoA carboxylase alpha subunit